MTIDHRRPLVAYLLCAVVCGFVIANSLRGASAPQLDLRSSVVGLVNQVSQPSEWLPGWLPSTTINRAPVVTSDALVPSIGLIQRAVAEAPQDLSGAASGDVQTLPAVSTDAPAGAPAAGGGPGVSPTQHSGGGHDHAAGSGGTDAGHHEAVKDPGTTATAVPGTHEGNGSDGSGPTQVQPPVTSTAGTAHGHGHANGHGNGHANGHATGKDADAGQTQTHATSASATVTSGGHGHAHAHGHANGTSHGNGKAKGHATSHGKAKGAGKATGHATSHGQGDGKSTGKSNGKAKGHQK